MSSRSRRSWSRTTCSSNPIRGIAPRNALTSPSIRCAVRAAPRRMLCATTGTSETDDGVMDALIAEGGIPGEEAGYAVGYLYTMRRWEQLRRPPTKEGLPRNCRGCLTAAGLLQD